MKPIRLIHVGMGGWGQDWAQNIINSCADVERVACVDVFPATLSRIQAQFDLPADACFTSLDAALAAVDADAVLITTTLAEHVPLALQALAAGKHVLVEKPFAPSLAEAQQAVAAARTHDRILMVSQNYRFFPAPRAVAATIRTGALGAVGAVNLQFRRYANTQPRGNHRHYELRHPLLLDMAIHHFDLMRLVLNQEPTAVTCHGFNPPWSNFSDPAAASATIAFDGGVVVSYQGSWISTAPQTLWSGEWSIECADGVINWTSRADVGTAADYVTIRRRGEPARRIAMPSLACHDRAGTLAEFVAAIRAGQEPECSGRDNLNTIALTFAAIESAQTGQPQTIQASPNSVA